ncbi:MAG: carboxypeptidase-like regulatory domain-containing protein [Saprospiraceae bacterium]|nr:carboxypeptidase-like regulatory domain-containing protein [Saprospiraceae bacterium]
MFKKSLLFTIFIYSCYISIAQKGTVFGSVYIQGKPAEFVTIQIKGTSMGTATDMNGSYVLENIPYGIHTLKADMVGMEPQE